MRDLVKAGFFAKLFVVFPNQDSLHVNVAWDRVFIHEFSQDDDLAFTLYRIHGGNPHMRTLRVLRAPLVGFGVAVDDVPTQVVHWNHLRRQILLVALRPDDLPIAVVVDEFEIFVLEEFSDSRPPLQAGAHQGFVAVIRDHAGVGVLQLRERL